jgi:hypothetical protein
VKFTTHIENDNIDMALNSNCDKIRFGAEFCEWKIPTMDVLKENYIKTVKEGKEFCYITPHTSNNGIEKIKKHMKFLNENGDVKVIVNDLGVLNIVEQLPNLRLHMGRQLITNLARCPWKELINPQAGQLEKKKIEKTLFQTNLNYQRTIEFFKEHGVTGVDLDWIPQCFEHYNFLTNQDIGLSIYLKTIPITITRKCHMARFLGYKDPEKCPKPCLEMAFKIVQPIMDIEMLVHGNAVLRLIEPNKSDIKKICKIGIDELIIPLNPVSNFESYKEINRFIEEFNDNISGNLGIFNGILSRARDKIKF